MTGQIKNTLYSEQISNKLKIANEKKFYLRKALYELDKLSYEKGTRKGDYLIREKIKQINDELELFDGRIKAFEADIINISLFREILFFFEENYLDNFILLEKIESLKDELINQEKNDQEHNLRHSDENYERSRKNTFRAELDKDISNFKNAIANRLVPNLTEFLFEINDLIFIEELNEKIKKWSIEKSFNEKDQV